MVMNGQLLQRRRKLATALAAVIAFALTTTPTSASAQTSVTSLPPGVTAWFVSADGSTVVGVEDTANGQFAFVLRGGNRTILSLGGTFSFPTGVSGDGTTVVGDSETLEGGIRGFVWTEGVGVDPLLSGSSFASANGISTDGSTIIGTHSTAQGNAGFVLNNTTGLTNLTFGGIITELTGVSFDGSTVVGYATLPGVFATRAFYWRAGDASPTLVPFADTSPSQATGVSADGSTVIGWKQVGFKNNAFVWTIGTSTASFIDFGGFMTTAKSLSADGSTVVGEGLDGANSLKGFAWRNGVTQVLALPAGRQYASASQVSADGARIVGYASNDSTDTLDYDSQDIVVWDGDAAPVFLKDLLVASGATLGEPRLRLAAGVSADGAVIVGDTFLRTGTPGAFTDVYGSFVSVLSTEQEATPAELTEDLLDDVLGLNLPNGLKTALQSKLETALAAIAQNDDITALAALTNFIDQVRAQRGKKIPAAAADQLIADAQAIIAKL
jgi:uncharacterized membrane protein